MDSLDKTNDKTNNIKKICIIEEPTKNNITYKK